jgi:hypothetical protein
MPGGDRRGLSGEENQLEAKRDRSEEPAGSEARQKRRTSWKRSETEAKNQLEAKQDRSKEPAGSEARQKQRTSWKRSETEAKNQLEAKRDRSKEPAGSEARQKQRTSWKRSETEAKNQLEAKQDRSKEPAGSEARQKQSKEPAQATRIRNKQAKQASEAPSDSRSCPMHERLLSSPPFSPTERVVYTEIGTVSAPVSAGHHEKTLEQAACHLSRLPHGGQFAV